MSKTNEPYDPLRVMKEAAETQDTKNQTVDKARDDQWKWVRARGFTKASTETLMEVGAILRKKEGTFWLEYVGCEMGCRKRVSDLGLRPSVADDWQFAAEVLAIKILLSAVAGDATALGRQLDEVTQAGQLDGVSEAVRSICDRLEPWCFGRENPLTPWITVAELSRACRARLTGLSASNVSKAVGKSQLFWELPLGPRKKYRLFGHATQQWEMLSHVVADLKTAQFSSFIFRSQIVGKTGRATR